MKNPTLLPNPLSSFRFHISSFENDEPFSVKAFHTLRSRNCPALSARTGLGRNNCKVVKGARRHAWEIIYFSQWVYSKAEKISISQLQLTYQNAIGYKGELELWQRISLIDCLDKQIFDGYEGLSEIRDGQFEGIRNWLPRDAVRYYHALL